MPREHPSLYADDSDTDNEVSTPKPRPGTRKRPSLINGDASSSEPRAHLRSVNINDDAAEKRRRRKSTKLVTMDSFAGPSTDPDGEEGADTSRVVKRGPPLTTVVQAPIIDVPIDITSSKYEEWMKLTTDNKINAGNSWSVALIDYFHDMSLLRNDGEQTINFQRASCTLDGCVKIWTSRVDSVGAETAKLASNLAGGRDTDDEEDDGSDNPDDEGTQSKKKKTQRSGATLAKDAAQLRSKKLDLEFSVDPLFKKTCADFDEGGAHGLLMNHLSLGVGKTSGLRVIFDASDSIYKEEEDDDEEPYEEVDLSHLRSTFLPNLAVLEDKAISHSLEDFSFAKSSVGGYDGNLFMDNTAHFGGDDDDDDGMDGTGFDLADDQPTEDFFQGDNAIVENYDGGMVHDDYGGDQQSNGSVGPTEGDETRPYNPAEASRSGIVIAMGEDGDEFPDTLNNTINDKSWAGPEHHHWKMRRPIRRSDGDPNASKTTKARKEKKEPFRIDFQSALEKPLEELQKEIFAPVGKGASINLPGTIAAGKKSRKKGKENEKRNDHTLPDDMHFTSRQLVTLFLKPKFTLRMRGNRNRDVPEGGDVDADFWAHQNAAQGDQDQNDTTGAVPFNTQFFHDDFGDGGGFDDVDDNDGDGDLGAEFDAGEQDLLASTQGIGRRIRPPAVNYAKRAKRVDVRKLKENIWRNLDIVISKPPEEEDANMDVDEDEPAPTDPEDGRVFSSVISGLQSSYPQDKMKEISTSFCFICLLHLANEQGLKINSGDGERAASPTEDLEGDNVVGNIWDLKVYRDPNATQSA